MTTKIFGSTVGDGSMKAIDIDTFFNQTVPGFGRGAPDSNSALYKAVSWSFRCVQLRSDAVSAVPFSVYKDSDDGKGEVEYTDFDLDMETLLRDTESFLCLYGASYWYKRRNQVTVKAIQILNSGTVEPIIDPADVTKGIQGFRQSIGPPRVYKPKQIVYFRYWHPSEDLMPGVCPASASGMPASLVKNQNLWASRFFENGAVPCIVLQSDKQLAPKDRKELRTGWERFTRGVRNAWRTVVLHKGVTAQVVSPPVAEMAMSELMQGSKEQIASAYGVPLAMLDESAANRATAEIHRLSFWTETIIPECMFLARVLNDQLFKPMGLRFEFHYNKIEAVQQHEAQKAKAYSSMMKEVNSGVASNIITVDEARAVMNDLLVKMCLPELGDTAPEIIEPVVEVVEPAGETDKPDVKPPDDSKAFWSEMKRWKVKSIRVGTVADFETEIIPENLKALIVDAGESVGVEGAFQFMRKDDSDQPEKIQTTAQKIRVVAENHIEGGQVYAN